MSLASGGHFHEGESFGTTGEIINRQVNVDNVAKLSKKFLDFRFGNIMGQIADKKLHVATPAGCDQHRSLSAADKCGNTARTMTKKTMCDPIEVRIPEKLLQAKWYYKRQPFFQRLHELRNHSPD
jgi:hypothetical protein